MYVVEPMRQWQLCRRLLLRHRLQRACARRARLPRSSRATNGSCGSIKIGNDPDNECATDADEHLPERRLLQRRRRVRAVHERHRVRELDVRRRRADRLRVQRSGHLPSGRDDALLSLRHARTGPRAATSCNTDPDCIAADYCRISDHSCQPDQAIGATCTAGSQCTSGNCIDGYCCDTACAGLCQACSAAKKGAGVNGVCGNVAGNSDPDAECADQGPNSCGTNGSCNGSGACTLYTNGTVCGCDRVQQRTAERV